MKKVLKTVMASLLALGLMAGGAQAIDAKEVMKVSGSAALLKAKADASAQTLQTLSNGQFVAVNNIVNGWASADFQGTMGAINSTMLAGNLPYTIRTSSSKGGVVIKQKPTTNAMTLANLKHGMVMEDYGAAENGYSFVRYGNIIGYAKTGFIATPKVTIKYLHANVDVRRIASPSGEIVGTAKSNTKVDVYANVAGWSYIKVNGVSGYVASSQLKNQQVSAKPAKPTAPKPKPTPPAGNASSGYDVMPGAPTSFKNCKDMNKYYPNGVHKSHPAYSSARDRDNDSWACEKN